MELDYVNDMLQLSIPCLIFAVPTVEVPSKFTPGFHTNFRIETSSEIVQVTSSSHKLECTFSSKTRCNVSLEPSTRDIELSIETSNRHLPQVLVEKMETKDKSEDLAVSLTFYPDYSSSTIQNEFIFLVDQSNSMRVLLYIISTYK